MNDQQPPTYEPTGSPPKYSKIMARVYPYTLRPVLIVTSALGATWAFIIAANAIGNQELMYTSAKISLFSIIVAVVHFVVGGIEVYGLLVGVLKSLKLAKALLLLAPIGVLLTFVGQTVNVVEHFSAKTDLINRCALTNANTTYYDSYGDQLNLTSSQAQSVCEQTWSSNSWTVFVWLLVTTIIAVVFGSIAIMYYRQLQDPTLIRRHQNWFNRNNQSNPQAYQMEPGHFYPNAPPPPQGGLWEVPPSYPGPPPEGTTNPFEKGEYHPSAEWAQSEPLAYHGEGGEGAHRAEEEAWARAEREGVTAHLTGHAPTPGSDEDDREGYDLSTTARRTGGDL